MLKIGVTGGIGSGKTTVCLVFESLGVSIFYADLVAREIVDNDRAVIREIKSVFGSGIYSGSGHLDRKAMAKVVFNDEEALKKLNGIVHPAVGLAFENWVEDHSGEPYVIKEAAILFESGSDEGLDKIITVSAPESLRIERVMKRDGVSEHEVRSRMKRQITEDERIRRADYIIYNDNNQMIIPQVMEIHRKLLAL